MRFIHPAWATLRDAGWALILVFVFRGITMALGVRPMYDHPIHFSGGFAMAYFIYRALGKADFFLGTLKPFTRLLLAFTSACCVAVFWEFGEFASDFFRGTHVQHDVAETLWDLIYGTSGAGCCLVVVLLVNTFKKQS